MLPFSATMKTSIYFVLACIAVISSSNKVEKLNSILKSIDWSLLRQEFPQLENARFVRKLPDGERKTHRINKIFFDGVNNGIYVTQNNFNKKLRSFYLLVKIIYACKLKHVIDAYKFIYAMYDRERYSLEIDFSQEEHWKVFSRHQILFKRMNTSLNYIRDLRDAEFGIVELNMDYNVNFAIDNILELIREGYFLIIPSRATLNQVYAGLMEFMTDHITPLPDPYSMPPQILEAFLLYNERLINYRETIHQKIEFAKGKVYDLMTSCVAVINAFGFKFDEFEQIFTIEELGVLSSCDKVQKLNTIFANINWGVLLMEFLPLANSNIIQVLSNERNETNINDLFFDGIYDGIYVTHENFHVKLPSFLLLMNIVYACKLKHIIDGYKFISEIYEKSNEHWNEFTDYHYLFKRMINSLNYIYNLKDPEFREIEMNRNNSVFSTLRDFFMTTQMNSFYGVSGRTKLTDFYNDLIDFIQLHVTPFPDPNLKPTQIQLAESFLNSQNLNVQEEIEIAKGHVDSLMESCVTISEAFGFIIDDNDRVSIVGEF